MEMFETLLEVKKLSPKAVLVGLQTDCLVFKNVHKHPELNNAWGGIKLCQPPNSKYLIKERAIGRLEKYSLTNEAWGDVNE
eukprot:7028217-Heterocapsa_arctica.AAC.1